MAEAEVVAAGVAAPPVAVEGVGAAEVVVAGSALR